MMVRSLTLLVPFLVLVAWAAPAEAATKVAVVDMAKIIREHPRHGVVEDNFRKARKDAEDNAKAARTRLEASKKEIEAMTDNEPGRVEAERRYQMQLNNTKFQYEWAIKQAVRLYAEGLESLFRAVRSEVAAYAGEQGIDIVLHETEPTARMNPTNPDDYELKRLLRPVVYASPKVNITEAILARVKAKR